MKRRSPYTIVNRPEELMPSSEESESRMSQLLGRKSPEGEAAFKSLPDALKRSISAAVINRAPNHSSKSASVPTQHSSPRSRTPGVNKLVQRLSSKDRVATVGLLDLGAWVSGLPRLLDSLNNAQRRFVFVELQTPVPAGMVKSEVPLVAWAERLSGNRISKSDRADLQRNMLADEFMYFAKSVGKEHGLDIVVGLTPAMIAFDNAGFPCWNYYSMGVDETALVSTFALRDYAREAKRPYEAAIGMLVVGQVLALRNEHLVYHAETRGCLFDFNEERGGLKQSLRKMQIDASCLALIPDREERECATTMLKSLASMRETSHA